MIIDGVKIGPEHPPYIIADMSMNHLGSFDRAMLLIKQAHAFGVHAIKPQLYTPDEMCKPGTIAKDGPWKGVDLYKLYEEAMTPREWFPKMFAYARKLGITMFSSVFSLDGVDFLESLGCPAYKIAAVEHDWQALIDKCMATGKPVFISHPHARQVIPGTIPLYNRPGYPVPFATSDMGKLKEGRGVFGLSSHVMDKRAFPMAVALGASILEMHMIEYRYQKSWDKTFSWEPHQFGIIKRDATACWEAMRPQDDKQPAFKRDAAGLRVNAV